MKDLFGADFTERQLKSNQPILLTGGDRLWWVKSGAIAIFAVETGSTQRRYLFDLEPESVLFELSSQQDLKEQLLAVPYEDTTVILIDYIAENLEASQLDLWLQQWGDRLNSVFIGTEINLPNWELVTNY